MKRPSLKLPALATLFHALAMGWALLPGCAPIDVNVGTREALKVDLNMDLHVFQHGTKGAGKKAGAAASDDAEKAADGEEAATEEEEEEKEAMETEKAEAEEQAKAEVEALRADREKYREIVTNRRNRDAEIQKLKDDQIVGESRRGLLEIRKDLAGTPWDPGYVAKTVDAENSDREYLIRQEAAQRGIPVEKVRLMMWRQWRNLSSPGSWIEKEEKLNGKPTGRIVWTLKGDGDT